MRHPIRAKERDAVLELCQDIWEDHDSTLYQMAMKRSADFARTMAAAAQLCDDLPTSSSRPDPAARRRQGRDGRRAVKARARRACLVRSL